MRFEPFAVVFSVVVVEHVFFDQLFDVAVFVRLAFEKRDHVAVLVFGQFNQKRFCVSAAPIVLALVSRCFLQLLFAFPRYGCIPPFIGAGRSPLDASGYMV